METLLHDISYGFRMLGKSPGFTAVAIITLALGIGANTALFSVVKGVLLNPLPYPEPASLISVYFNTTQFQQSSVPYLISAHIHRCGLAGDRSCCFGVLRPSHACDQSRSRHIAALQITERRE
jgi:hypothetical protein